MDNKNVTEDSCVPFSLKRRIIIKIVDEIPENIPDNESIYNIATRYTPNSWIDVFRDSDLELQQVSRIIEQSEERENYISYPQRQHIFNAFYHTSLPSVKVVIIGQDPYHQIGADGLPRAMGMSFSVRRESGIPSSLSNIFTEIASNDSSFTTPHHGDLTSWAKQGVFLLNSCLTVKPNLAGSHKKIWYGFMSKVIRAINVANPNVIYVLWGRAAQSIAEMIGDKVTILEAAHPSGLSANRGFFGCKHFSMINAHLTTKKQKPINWNLE